VGHTHPPTHIRTHIKNNTFKLCVATSTIFAHIHLNSPSLLASVAMDHGNVPMKDVLVNVNLLLFFIFINLQIINTVIECQFSSISSK